MVIRHLYARSDPWRIRSRYVVTATPRDYPSWHRESAYRRRPRVGLAKGFATGTADGLVLDLDLDPAALNSHDQPVAPTLMPASASAPFCR